MFFACIRFSFLLLIQWSNGVITKVVRLRSMVLCLAIAILFGIEALGCMNLTQLGLLYVIDNDAWRLQRGCSATRSHVFWKA